MMKGYSKSPAKALCLGWILLLIPSFGFAFSTASFSLSKCCIGQKYKTTVPSRQLFESSSRSFGALFASVSPEAPKNDSSSTATKAKKSLHPRVGDLVRYFDLDGGKKDGQVFVGKISFISTIKSDGGGYPSFEFELTELDDVGDGYFAEYPSRQRLSKRTTRVVGYGSSGRDRVSPISGSFVRTEQAFRVPRNDDGTPRVRQESYDLEDYLGPGASTSPDYKSAVNTDVVTSDGILYQALKNRLLKYAALTGAAGSVITSIVKGPEDAAIYAGGAAASVLYLWLLSLKTDTMASTTGGPRLGSNVANLRFVTPILLLVGVSTYNRVTGQLPENGTNLFDTVTPEQFAAAILGFLTYRLPLFFSQLQEAFSAVDEDGKSRVTLPGSAGVAMQLADSSGSSLTTADGATLPAVLLVSGPQATTRNALVKKLLEESDGTLTAPTLLDRVQDAVTFERLEKRDELLDVDASNRYALTADGLLKAAVTASKSSSAVVVNADVPAARRIAEAAVGKVRVIGVWVGRDSIEAFETNLKRQIEEGTLTVPPDESVDDMIRGRVKSIVKEIQYGLSAATNLFEFTVLDGSDGGDEPSEEALKELKQAATYLFK